MGFEENALVRLRRYREEADHSLKVRHSTEETTCRFAERLFESLEYVAVLGRQTGFGVEVERAKEVLVLRVEATPGAEAHLTLGLLRGAATEMDEDLMHEDLSRYNLDPSGYSGRILGWSEEVGEEACQTFAVYGDGVWKTKGLFVTKARGWTTPGRGTKRLRPAHTRTAPRPGGAHRGSGSKMVGGGLHPPRSPIEQGAPDGATLATVTMPTD